DVVESRSWRRLRHQHFMIRIRWADIPYREGIGEQVARMDGCYRWRRSQEEVGSYGKCVDVIYRGYTVIISINKIDRPVRYDGRKPGTFQGIAPQLGAGTGVQCIYIAGTGEGGVIADAAGDIHHPICNR